MRQKDILLRYAKEMCTKEEADNIRYYNALENSLIVSYMFLWTPLSVAFWMKYRQDPANNRIFKIRMLTIHFFQLPILIYANF